MAALGPPEGPAPAAPAAPGDPKKPAGSGYLAKKPPKLKAFLMDAVDPSLSHEERAEALCRALEEQGGAETEEAEPEEAEDLAAPPMPVGEGFEDY